MLQIRPLTLADVGFGLQLSSQAGWNQTAADWQRCLDLEPKGGFVAELDGAPVGTTTVCTFGPVAWIALVLVDVAVRGRGIGTALVKHALAWLESRPCLQGHLAPNETRVRSIWLDATPLGQPVYERLGFQPEFTLLRYHGAPCGSAEGSGDIKPLRGEHVVACARLDQSAMGTDRTRLLERLFAEDPEGAQVAVRDGVVRGFVAARRGSQAVQVGPCLAEDDTGRDLLRGAWKRFAGQKVFVDIPEAHRRAVQSAESEGLTVQRQLLRMRRGDRLGYDLDRLWASFGPEKG